VQLYNATESANVTYSHYNDQVTLNYTTSLVEPQWRCFTTYNGNNFDNNNINSNTSSENNVLWCWWL